MNSYDLLIGQTFRRGGARYTIVKVSGAVVVAAVIQGNRVERVFVPLATVLEDLDVDPIELTELPAEAPRSLPAPVDRRYW